MLIQVCACYPPDRYSSFILSLRLASASAASTAAWAFSLDVDVGVHTPDRRASGGRRPSVRPAPPPAPRGRGPCPSLRPSDPAVPLPYLPNTLRHQGLRAPS